MKPTTDNNITPKKSNKISIDTLLKIIGITCTAIYIWEYAAKVSQTTIKPSVALTFIETNLQSLFRVFGSYCAQISSFIWQIEWTSFIQTFKELISPISGSTTSPIYTVIGYYETVKQRYDGNLSLIVCGSLMLIALLSSMAYKYKTSKQNPIKTYVNKLRGIEN